MRIAGYARVSTVKQADEGVSLDVQREQIESYASLRGWEIVAYEVDAGLSGSSMDRPGIRRLLSDIEGGRIDALVAFDQSRLTRSGVDWYSLVKLCRDAGCKIELIRDPVDIETADGQLPADLKIAINQYQRRKIGENTRLALAHRAAAGKAVGGVPTACVRQGDFIVETPERKRLVRRVKSLRGRGHSFRVIGERVGVSGQTARRIHHGRGDNE